MLACARGHLMCGKCGVEVTKKGKECPMCGELKSLLTKTLKHDCTKGAR